MSRTPLPFSPPVTVKTEETKPAIPWHNIQSEPFNSHDYRLNSSCRNAMKATDRDMIPDVRVFVSHISRLSCIHSMYYSTHVNGRYSNTDSNTGSVILYLPQNPSSRMLASIYKHCDTTFSPPSNRVAYSTSKSSKRLGLVLTRFGLVVSVSFS